MKTRKVTAASGKVYEYEYKRKSKEQQEAENKSHKLNYTVIHVKKKDKPVFDECKELIIDELGRKITFSQMFSILCKDYIEKRKEA